MDKPRCHACKKKNLRNGFKQTFNQSSMTRIKLLKRDITLVSERLLIMKQQTICTFPTLFFLIMYFLEHFCRSNFPFMWAKVPQK